MPGNPHYTEITLIFLADYQLNRQRFFWLVFLALEFAQYTPRGDVCFDSVRLFNDFSNGITCDNDNDDDDGNVRFRFVCCPMPIHTLSGIDRTTRDATTTTMKTKIGGEATIRLRR